jgi:hypothetical protein
MNTGIDLTNTTELEEQIKEALALALGISSTDFDVTFTAVGGTVVAEVLVTRSSMSIEEVSALTQTAFEGL